MALDAYKPKPSQASTPSVGGKVCAAHDSTSCKFIIPKDFVPIRIGCVEDGEYPQYRSYSYENSIVWKVALRPGQVLAENSISVVGNEIDMPSSTNPK